MHSLKKKKKKCITESSVEIEKNKCSRKLSYEK